MKSISKIYPAILLLLAFGFFQNLNGQNAAPTITNIMAIADTVAHQVTVTYDLSDLEGDNLEVWLQVSADSGWTWMVPADSITGDVGFPITPTTGKQAVWTYDPVALTNYLGSPGLQGFRVRVVANDRIPIDIADLVAQVDSARIMQNLQFIEGVRHRTAGLTHLMNVRDSLRALMAEQGLQPWHDAWAFSGYNAENLIARRSGVVAEAKTWLVSGHYDSVNIAPGADDNGSAVVGVMEALKVLGPLQFEQSVRYIFFDLEEVSLNGSARYVANFIPDWEDTEGLLNMETMGYYSDQPNSQSIPFGFSFLFPAATDSVNADSGRGNFLTNVANTPSSDLQIKFDSCARAYVPGLRIIDLTTPGTGISTPDLLRSDHAPFWTAGLPALMLTDGADYRNPHYHLASDTLGTLTPQFLFRNIKAVIATLATLAKPIHAGVGESNDFILNALVSNQPTVPVHRMTVVPNPGEEHFTLLFSLDVPSPLEVSVFNMEGRLIKKLADRNFAAGDQEIEWDAKNEAGNKVSKGMYLMTIRHANGVESARVLVGNFGHHH